MYVRHNQCVNTFNNKSYIIKCANILNRFYPNSINA